MILTFKKTGNIAAVLMDGMVYVGQHFCAKSMILSVPMVPVCEQQLEEHAKDFEH